MPPLGLKQEARRLQGGRHGSKGFRDFPKGRAPRPWIASFFAGAKCPLARRAAPEAGSAQTIRGSNRIPTRDSYRAAAISIKMTNA